MATQASGGTGLSPAVNIYYEKKMLEDFEPNTHFYSLAPVKRTIPKEMGKTIEFTRYNKLTPRYADDSSEASSNQVIQSTEVVTAVIRERSAYVDISRLADLTAIGGALEQSMDNLEECARKTLDILIRNDIGMAVADIASLSAVNMQNLNIDGGTLNHTGITVKLWTVDAGSGTNARGFDMMHNKGLIAQSTSVVSLAKSGMTIKTIQAAVNVLEGRDVPKINGAYHAIMHPTSLYQLTTSTGYKGWLSPTTAQPAKNSPAAIETISGVRLYSSTLAYRFPLSGDTLATSSGAIFGTLIFGKEAYGAIGLANVGGSKGFELNMAVSGNQSTNDVNRKLRQAGFLLYNVGKILNKDAGIFIITTEEV